MNEVSETTTTSEKTTSAIDTIRAELAAAEKRNAAAQSAVEAACVELATLRAERDEAASDVKRLTGALNAMTVTRTRKRKEAS